MINIQPAPLYTLQIEVVDFCLAHRERLNVCIEDLGFNLRFYENLNRENECVKRVYTIATLQPNR